MGDSDTNDKNGSLASDSSQKRYMDIVRPGKVNYLNPKSPEKAKTLMRTVVSKPKIQITPIETSQPILGTNAADDSPTAISKRQLYSIPSGREARAQSSKRSDSISKFSSIKQSESNAVFSQDAVTEIPVANIPVVTPPEPIQHEAATKIEPGSANIFERSLNRASAEDQPPLVNHHHKDVTFARKLTASLAAGISVLLIGGFFVYQNHTRIDMYVASSKAGFSATSPSYHPSGYDITNISSAYGVIDTSYHSTSDSRAYKITEKTSAWDNETLLDSFVQQVAGQNYQTYRSDGMTIYLYGNHDATWVNGGIWYVINGNNSLSTQQLIELATSM